MDPESMVNPELLAGLALFPRLELSMATLGDARAAIEDMMAVAPVEPSAAVMEAVFVPGPVGAPAVRVLIYRPPGAALLPAILHLHGGGYVMGSPDLNDAGNRLKAMKLGCAIVSVEYRLAPETPHPGPIEDCFAALAWLHGHAARLGVDRNRIGVMGESAGGGLAAALALLARDRGLGLAFQHLIYPMLDDRTCVTAEPHPFAGAFIWTPQQNSFGWSCLLGAQPGAAGVCHYAAASRAADLTGLPPAFIAVGALDLFIDENLDYARRLGRAGVPIEMHVYAGAYHGFDMIPEARVAVALRRDSQAALRRCLHG